MEFLGMLFLLLFFCIFEIYAVAAIFGVLLIISLITLIPEEKRPAAQFAGGVILILVSLGFLISI